MSPSLLAQGREGSLPILIAFGHEDYVAVGQFRRDSAYWMRASVGSRCSVTSA